MAREGPSVLIRWENHQRLFSELDWIGSIDSRNLLALVFASIYAHEPCLKYEQGNIVNEKLFDSCNRSYHFLTLRDEVE